MPSNGRVLLRLINPNDRLPPKQDVFKLLLQTFNIPLIALKPTKTGFNAITEHQEETDKLLAKTAQKELNKIGLEVKIPPRMKAERAIIVRKIDSTVGERSKEELKEEIERCNNGLVVDEVVKFPRHTHLFKIEFQTISMAEKAREKGLLIFNMKVTPHQIEKEHFTDILMCFTCYQLDSHITDNCPQKGKLVICSECSGDHHFQQCNSQTKKCVNCGGPHRTMAMGCPKKKDIAKRKRQEATQGKLEKEELTYAKVAEKTIEKVTKQAQQIEQSKTILEETGMRALIMVMDAHVHNIIQPGSYNSRLNETLKSNNIAPIKLPNNPSSDKLFRHNVIGNTLMALRNIEREAGMLDTNTTTEKQTREERESECDEMDTLDEQTEEEEILERHFQTEKNLEKQKTETPVLEVREINVELFACVPDVKKDNLDANTLTEMFKKGKIKYTIKQGSNITTEIVERLLNNRRIKANQTNITFLPAAEYKKIRSGYSRSPPEDPRLKRSRNNRST